MHGSNEEMPVVALIFTSVVVNVNGKEEAVQLMSFYPYYGKRDIEVEVDSANTFHEMCRVAYFDENREDDNAEEEDTPIDESNITFNEDDERW